MRAGSPGSRTKKPIFSGKSMANQWKINGKSMANQWQINGKSMENQQDLNDLNWDLENGISPNLRFNMVFKCV